MIYESLKMNVFHIFLMSGKNKQKCTFRLRKCQKHKSNSWTTITNIAKTDTESAFWECFSTELLFCFKNWSFPFIDKRAMKSATSPGLTWPWEGIEKIKWFRRPSIISCYMGFSTGGRKHQQEGDHQFLCGLVLTPSSKLPPNKSSTGGATDDEGFAILWALCVS